MVTDAEETSVASAATDAPPHRRWVRRAVVGAVGLLLASYGAAGWYVSGEIINGVRIGSPTEPTYDTEVVEVRETQITLRRPDEASLEADRDAVLGMTWVGGYGQIGPTVSQDGDLEVRELTVLTGSVPPRGVDVGDVDPFAFPNDPTILGLEVRTVSFDAPLGPLEAWLFPGEGATWLIGVHGQGAERFELLRTVDALRELGYPTLLIQYRNDPGAPATDDSLVLLGQREWPDVAAAVDFALANGATDVVVYGASMGGALTLGYLTHGNPEAVRGVILESAPADMREIVRLRSGEALPVGGPIGDSILAVGRVVTWLRTGFDFDEVDYVDRAAGLDVPVLWLHGTDDPKAPVEVARAFAAARPDLVEYHEIDGGGHVRAWNEGPDAYTETLTTFLTRIGRTTDGDAGG